MEHGGSSGSIRNFREMIHRQYMTVEQAVAELDRILFARKAAGFDTLPPERTMAKEIHCSIMTLRRALDRMEKLGRIVRDSGVKRICDTARNLSPGHSISVTLTASGDGLPGNPHYRRIAQALEQRFDGTPVHFRIVCLCDTDSPNILARKLADSTPSAGLPDVVIYADSPVKLQAQVLSLRGRTLLVGVNEEYVGMCDCVVALNNFEAGRMAGQMLLEAGCRNPAVIYSSRDLLPFYHRRDGFLTALAEAELPTDNVAYGLIWNNKNNRDVESSRTLLETVCGNAHDGLFLFTDQGAQTWRGRLEKRFRIPGEFKLVTLDASGVCRKSERPISAVSHGTDRIVQALEDLIVARAQGRPFQKITLVTPDRLPGTTL